MPATRSAAQQLLRVSERARAFIHDERGASNAVAFMVLFPVLMLVLFVGLHLTIGSIGQSAAQGAAVAAYNQGRLYGASTSAAEAYGQQIIENSVGVLGGTVDVGSDGETVTVTVTAQVPTIVPGIGNQVIATVAGPAERWVD